jgi:hypothetical protein
MKGFAPIRPRLAEGFQHQQMNADPLGRSARRGERHRGIAAALVLLDDPAHPTRIISAHSRQSVVSLDASSSVEAGRLLGRVVETTMVQGSPLCLPSSPDAKTLRPMALSASCYPDARLGVTYSCGSSSRDSLVTLAGPDL